MTKGSVRVQFGRQLRTGTALAMVTLFAGATFAAAQTAPATTTTSTTPASQAAAPSTDTTATVSTRNKTGAESTVVIITGSRTSQRSSIDRKKKAKTATDSIVAEDIGSFPDKNIDEAVSRIAGISLDRGTDGEGQGFSIRGNGMEQTMVDVDGMTVLNTNGALAGGASNSTGGRAADLRELPAEMVKSIDVIKGTTAAMTEGSLGGTVHIETRTGLDFKKPFFQLTGGQQMDSTTGKWTPEWTAIFARKFFGGRFGIVGNVNYEEIQTTSDQEQPDTSGQAGLSRSANFNQQTGKTFNWATAPIDPTQTAGNLTITNAKGATEYQSLSPDQIVAASGKATTPQQCQAAFPALTSAQLAGITGGTGTTENLGGVVTSNPSTSTLDTAAQAEQTNELQTCLNQFNEYAPSLIRFIPQQSNERRLAIELRGDYRVNDDLTMYAIGNIANRTVHSNQWTLNLGSPAFNQAGTYTQQTFSSTSTTNSLNTPKTVNTGLGYNFISNGLCPTTVSGTGTAQTTTGCGVETDMNNIMVDSTGHVTSFTLNDGSVTTDTVDEHTDITTWNAQVGGHYHHDNVKLDFYYGDSGSNYIDTQLRTNVSAVYGAVNVSLLPDGLWTYALPSNLDIANLPFAAVTPTTTSKSAGGASNVQAAVPAYTAAQAADWGTNFTLTWRPKETDDHEKQLKWDLTYDFEDKIPFFQDIQFGMQDRDHVGDGWSGGGYTVSPGVGNVGDADYVAPVVLPTENLTVNYRSCTPTATSTQPCDYGWTPGSTVGTDNNAVANLNDTLFGTMTYTPQALASLISNSLYTKTYPFLGDYPNKGNVLSVWPLINPDVIAAAMPQQAFNLDCLKVCEANNGQFYSQPHFAYQEKTNAMYFMFDFEQKLPWGMVFNGNAGDRYIHTDTNATGFMTFNHIAVTSAYNPITNPTATTTTSFSLNTSLVSHTNDWTPSYNLNLWVIPDKVVLRYYSGHVISRPPPGALLPSGTCTIDDRNTAAVNDLSDEPNSCSGRVGNPGLQPYKAINHNETIEWYPNKDDEFSLAYYYNNVLVGAPINANLPATTLFANGGGGGLPAGLNVQDLQFIYPSYVNGPSGLQRGVEFASKLAFTFLPWWLKYTGTDFNYSKLGYKDFQTSQDLVTADFNPPTGQRSWTENWSLWYDDGRLNARVTYQGQSAYFDFISSCSNAINNQPTSFAQCSGQTIRTPYNPGGSNWRALTRFLDAKINYKINAHLEFYVQGRNILRAPTYQEYQPDNPYANGTPNLEAFSYGGARWETGFTWRN